MRKAATATAAPVGRPSSWAKVNLIDPAGTTTLAAGSGGAVAGGAQAAAANAATTMTHRHGAGIQARLRMTAAFYRSVTAAGIILRISRHTAGSEVVVGASGQRIIVILVLMKSRKVEKYGTGVTARPGPPERER